MTTHSEPLILPEKPNAPIACDLTDASDTPDQRIAEYGQLFARALVDRERTTDAVELRFAAKPGVAEWVTDLARREGACCPFLTYEVRVDGARVVWRISTQAGPAAQAILDEFHALPERVGDGFKGLLERLDARGFSVVSPALGRFALDDGERKPGVLDRIKAACGC